MTEKLSATESILALMQRITTTQMRDLDSAQKMLTDWLTMIRNVQPQITWFLRMIPSSQNDHTMDLVMFDGVSIRQLIIDTNQITLLPVNLTQFLLQLHYKNDTSNVMNPKTERVARIIGSGAIFTNGVINQDILDLCNESLA